MPEDEVPPSIWMRMIDADCWCTYHDYEDAQHDRQLTEYVPASALADVWESAMRIANICIQEHDHRPDELGGRVNPAACIYLALETARDTALSAGKEK